MKEVEESKFADELRKRGFAYMPVTTINRKERRRLTKIGAGPTFSQSKTDPITFATDETHRSWYARGQVDLSDLGFKNNTEETAANLEALYRKMRNTSKKFN